VELWGSLVRATEGGKRFRPALLAMAYSALGGTDDEAAATAGAAVELLHTAFVVHDDVIDDDEVRRGRLNVNGWHAALARRRGARPDAADHYGRTAAILVGDLALAAAVRAVATCPMSRDTVDRMLELFDHALHTTAAGELADVRLALRTEDATLIDALTMEEHKTAVYSFSLPLQAAAILAGADQHVVDRLGEAGRMLGIAFQLVDDVLGVFGDPATTGKSAVGDLREGKQTPLIAHARTTPQWADIAVHLGRPDLSAPEAAAVAALLVEAGSRAFVEDLAADYTATALAMLDELGMLAAFLSWLSTLTDRAAGRAA
jgi:geranylgeranyl diphosphate synthase type II